MDMNNNSRKRLGIFLSVTALILALVATYFFGTNYWGGTLLSNSANDKLLNQRKLSLISDPKTVDIKSFFSLNHEIDARVQPPFYPWHHWANNQDGSYPLNTEKFVSILSQLGKGTHLKVSLQEGLDKIKNGEDFIRLSGDHKPFIIRGGKVLRPHGSGSKWETYEWNSKGHQIDFVTLLENALELASKISDKVPRMKLISEGDFPIIFDAFDYPWCGDDLVPVFRMYAIKNSTLCPYAWPTLSQRFIVPQKDYALRETPFDWDTQFDKWESTYPWKQKRKEAVWRDRPTGYKELYSGEKLPREKLLWRTERNPTITDAKIIEWGELEDSTAGSFRKHNSRLDPEDYMKFRAVIDIDSNTASPRFGKLLCMNSVVIKVDSRFSEYWEKELIPWHHYIPVKSDVTDIKMRINWALNDRHQNYVQGIISNANAWCRKKMLRDQHVIDLMWTLLGYAELLADSPDFHEKWKSDYYAYELPELEMATFEGKVTI